MKIFDSTYGDKPEEENQSKKNSQKSVGVVTAIKAQVKNENRVSIFLDGKYSFSLTLDQLLEQKLKKSDELNEVDIKQLKKLSDEGKIRQRAVEWVMGRPHSTRELRDYLYRKKVEKDFMEQLIDDFTDKKYIDDHRFAEFFADNRRRKNKSTRAIRSELMAKGIPSGVADSVLGELETGNSEALNKLISKIENRPRYQDEQKLKAYLVSKGFSYGEVKTALEERNNSG